MALIMCPECKRDVSNKVRSCPHCGYPFSQEELVFSPNAIYQQVPDEHSINRDQNIKTLPAKRKRNVKLLIPIALLILIMVAVFFLWVMPSIAFNSGLKDIYNEDYEEALGTADLLPKERADLLRQELNNYCLEKAKLLVEKKQYQKAIDVSQYCTELNKQVVKDTINVSIAKEVQVFIEKDIMNIDEIRLSLMELSSKYFNASATATPSELAERIRNDEKYLPLGNEIEVLFLHTNPIATEYMRQDMRDVFLSYMEVLKSLREIYKKLPRLGFMTPSQVTDIVDQYNRSWDEFNDELKQANATLNMK